jgi:hypothetical protein
LFWAILQQDGKIGQAMPPVGIRLGPKSTADIYLPDWVKVKALRVVLTADRHLES